MKHKHASRMAYDRKHYEFNRTDPTPHIPITDPEDKHAAIKQLVVEFLFVVALVGLFWVVVTI